MPTIVVLDDDEVIRDLLETVLTDAGYDTTVASGLDAIPAHARPDLVIVDLIPVKAYGRDAALDWVRYVRSRFSGGPLLVVTAHAGALAESDSLGANAVLAKPFDVEALLAKVDELLR